MVVALALALLALPAANAVRPAKTSESAVEGTVVEYKRRTGALLLQAGRTRHRLYAKRTIPITANGKRARHEWLARDVPVRATLGDTRRTDGRPVVASIDILTAQVTGRILSIDRSGRFRIARDAAPSSQPTATQPTSAPTRTRRARRSRRKPSLYLTTVSGTAVTNRGKYSAYSRLEKGHRVEVTYIPAGRHPMALAINVIAEPERRGGPAVRIRIAPDGTVETIQPEDTREQRQRSNDNRSGPEDRRR